MVTSKKEAKQVLSRCCICQTEFTTIAAENRHVEETKHARYETVIDAEH